MAKELTPDEKYLVSVRESMSRMLKTEDGKTSMEFLESMVGWEFPLPDENIHKANGARSVICMMKNITKETPVDNFLDHCVKHYDGGKLVK
jgi:hypothetical protein